MVPMKEPTANSSFSQGKTYSDFSVCWELPRMEMIKSNMVHQINSFGPASGKTQVHSRYGPNVDFCYRSMTNCEPKL